MGGVKQFMVGALARKAGIEDPVLLQALECIADAKFNFGPIESAIEGEEVRCSMQFALDDQVSKLAFVMNGPIVSQIKSFVDLLPSADPARLANGAIPLPAGADFL